MFGISFFELILIGAVALIVVGPEKLPGMLGTLGRWSAKLRRMVAEVRQQTGIDDILREQGITGGLSELRQLQRAVKGDIASLGRLTTSPSSSGGSSVASSASSTTTKTDPTSTSSNVGRSYDYSSRDQDPYADVPYDRDREFPAEGADAYGCLPDDMWYDDAAEQDAPSEADAAQAPNEQTAPEAKSTQSNAGSTAPAMGAPGNAVLDLGGQQTPSGRPEKPPSDSAVADPGAADGTRAAVVATRDGSTPGPELPSAAKTPLTDVLEAPSAATTPSPTGELKQAQPAPQSPPSPDFPPPPSATGRASSAADGSARGASLPPPRKPSRN